ncbi:MAG: 30S ribosomal protein S1 [Candidatus Yanofskybacteria bacterium CG10_big_fil_rev_8_21_14_0_10_36_16]|uniref:30S ribosomal protein S1 n=1 Tax=Candidatus Yanofskybacteria bacterium CG10_big_fil_rev_8_21_14_0_10_36_16 TaxID=1975096 RepID=A0A2J0Q933_9BACT|nr:MAG: 30S ribosomal protein S1 [Candidatus Yanofskybacteria bacterium CG10_big_fil_rev_8_21_14_0_10_36_16]
MNTTTIQHSSVSMKDLLTQANFDLPKEGDVVKGEIISVSKNNIFIDLGAFGTGIVYPGEFYDNLNMQKTLIPGQKISAILIDIETEDGFRELSLKQAQKTTAWHDIKKLKDDGTVITTPIININKGGAIVEIGGIQGFLPLSQLSSENYPKVEGGDTTKIVQHLQKLKNKNVKIKILDFNEEETKLIVSEKAVGDEETKKEIEKFEIGDVVEGIITGVTDFGAFVSLTPNTPDKETGGDKPEDINKTGDSEQEEPEEDGNMPEVTSVEGLIHISEIDWKLISDPRDFLKKGQRVKAKIISIDGTKISLSLKALKQDPWQGIDKKYPVGTSLKATITKVNNYGALAALDEEITGLIPSSEFVGKKPADSAEAGNEIDVTVVSVDPEEHKLILTLSQHDKSKDVEPETSDNPNNEED